MIGLTSLRAVPCFFLRSETNTNKFNFKELKIMGKGSQGSCMHPEPELKSHVHAKSEVRNSKFETNPNTK